MSELIKIIPFIKPYKNLIFWNFIFNVLSVIFSVFSISLIIPVLGILFGTIETSNPELITENVNFLSVENLKIWIYGHINTLIVSKGLIPTLGIICFFIILFSLLKNITRYLALFFLTPIRNNIVRDLRNKLKTTLLHFPLSLFQKFKKGDVISRITHDLTEIEWSIIGLLELILKDPAHIIIFLIGLSFINLKLTLLCFLLFPVTGFIIAIISKNLKKTSLLNQEKIAELISLIEQNISGIKIIKAFNKENFIIKNFVDENEKQKNIANKVLWRKDLSSPMSEVLSTITMVIIIWVGGKMVLNESLQADSFIGFTIMFSQIIAPAKSLTSSFYSIKKGSAAIDRINEFLNVPGEDLTSKTVHKKFEFQNNIQFANINFSYENQKVIKNLSLNINKGEKIAIVGESGCGKTTMIDLLLKFFSVDSGSIKIDGNNIEQANLGSLRSLFGFVSQNVFLFNDSIANNINFGNTNPDLENIIDAAKKANAHEFISKLEHGYNTIIKNQGDNLSSGEKQRISIARAILSDFPILIFDEATSALDSKSSQYIQNLLKNIEPNKTCIIITHKLNAIKNVDKIFVMKNGQIVEQGTHKLLLNSSKIYKQLYNLQEKHD